MYDPTAYNPLDANDEFMRNLRESLKGTYLTGTANLQNQRYLDHSTIMNQANKAGSLFSNVPQRAKIQYDTNTFMPGQVQLRNTYQTGLDTIRNNAINAANQVRYYQDMINHYNTMPTNTSSSTATAGADEIAAAVKAAIEANNNS